MHLHFISVHPIHYNDYLFSEIRKNGIPITVHYTNPVLKNYPWKEKNQYIFNFRNCRTIFKIDMHLLKLVIGSGNNVFLVAGWDTVLKNMLLLFLIIFRRKYIIWTDTPKIGDRKKNFKEWIRRKWLGLIFDHSFRLFVTGNVGVKAMKRIYCDHQKIKNFPFLTDSNYFDTVPDFSTIRENDIQFFSSGRLLLSHKAYDVSIKALSILKQKGYRFHYSIAGEGPDRKVINDLISAMGLESEITLLGWQELTDIRSSYAGSHVFLHPSHIDPFPNAILEAMASGLIVIASDGAGSALERIRHGENGFIFRDNEVEEMVKCLEMVMGIENDQLTKISNAAAQTSHDWGPAYNLEILASSLSAKK